MLASNFIDLGVRDAGFHFAFSIRIADPARQGDGSMVRQHIPIQRVEYDAERLMFVAEPGHEDWDQKASLASDLNEIARS